jgi:PAS domain S-box-containing protein
VQLESANEELQATNEELQAANEELQATNEELHSINEELYSVNEEHENKIEELNQVASNLHNLMQATEVGSVFTDRENQVRLFTPVATRIFNLLPQDVGRDIHHITSRIPNDNIFTAMDRVSAGGAPEEQLVITPEHQSFLRRIKPYVDLGNKTGGLVLTFVDVSELRATENLLRERTAELASREGQFRDLLDQAPEGVLMVNSAGNISQTNPQLDAIFGYEHGELLGSPAQRLFREELPQQEAPDGMVHLSDRIGLHKNGQAIDLQLRRGSLQFQGELFSIAFVSDITRRKQAELDLRESEGRFRAIFQNAGVGNVVTDLRGYCILANRSICEMLGYREDELQLRTLHQLTHPDDQAALQNNLSKLLSGDLSIFNAEQRYLRKDGSSVWARTNAILLRDQEGQALQFLAQLENISDLKASLQRQQEMERQLTAASKLESLGLLAGGVAHDFNNILAGILANAEFLRHHSGADESVGACLDDISNACLRASDICQQLLASSGKHPHEPKETDLSWLVRDTERLIRAALRKGVRLHLALAPDLPPVNIDRGQLQQVVMNLVLNASEAIKEQGGDIFVRTSRAQGESDGKPLPAAVLLEVEDNGAGISAENLDKIFDPFFTTKFKGRGLGLAAVKGIVNSHQGQLDVTSTPGHGTAFRLRLPAIAAPQPEEPGTPTNLPKTGTHRGLVLVVDDEPLVRTSLRRLLSGQGYEVAEASNGAEAIGIFADAPESFSAVLLDLTMPLMDGAKTLPHLLRIRPNTRVILTSGYNESQSISTVVEQGLAVFLKKPIRSQELLEALQRAPQPSARPVPQPS